MNMLERKHMALLDEARRQGHPDIAAVGLVFGVLALAAAIDHDCAARLGAHGLSEGRFVLLFLLASEEGSAAAPSRLAKRAGVTKATVTTLLDSLERDGLVTRHRESVDRRTVTVHLTPHGRDLAGRLVDEHTRWVAGLTDALEIDERATLLAVKGVGPKVIERIEQLGISSLCELARWEAGELCVAIAAALGSTCWRNSPQARSAMASAIDVARQVSQAGLAEASTARRFPV